MKKLILTSMLASVGLFAQSSGTTPATPAKPNTAAPAQSQAPVKAKHRHKKSTAPAATATPSVKPSAPAAPANK